MSAKRNKTTRFMRLIKELDQTLGLRFLPENARRLKDSSSGNNVRRRAKGKR